MTTRSPTTPEWEAHTTSSSDWGPRLALRATVVICVVLVPVQLGWVPYFKYAWGYTLWQYLPMPVSLALALALILICVRMPREFLIRNLSRSWSALEYPALRWFGLAALFLALWVLRERVFLGDSAIFLYVMAASTFHFVFPDIGGTFLLYRSFDLARHLGLGGLNGAQFYVCACGVAALACFAKVGTYLAPTPARAAFATALIFCGGIPRIFAGHIEVYSFLLVCLGAYFWAAFAYLEGRCSWKVPALVVGLGFWTHLSFVFLVPSLFVLSLLGNPSRPLSERIRQWSGGLALVSLPMIAFFGLEWLSGHGGDLTAAGEKLVMWSQVGAAPNGYEAWLRPWGEPGAGTRYVILSWPHLRYLANSFFLLAPAVVPVISVFAISSIRRMVLTPRATFLTSACATMLVYTLIVRPVFGPYDWDLFCVTAVCFAALSAHLLTHALKAEALAHLGTLLIVATLLLVTIPLLIIGIAPGDHVGPFTMRVGTLEQLERELAPWL